MKALVLTELQKPLKVLNMPEPTLAPDGVIVRVEANGICRSDWHAWMGDFGWLGINLELPFVMGHEFCGIIEEVGSEVKKFKKGERVIVPFSQGDGTCEFCVTGHQNVCENTLQAGFSYWGGYGQFAHVPNADVNLVTLPDSIDFVAAAGLGCRFMTSFHGIVDQAQVRPGEWVAIHGCGGIGLSAIHIASSIGAKVIAVDINNDTLKLAKELGAALTINAREKDAVGEIVELTKGGVHVSVDALGVTTTCQNAVNSLRKRGRHLQIGLTTQEEQGMVPLPVDLIVQKELSIIGSLGMQAARYPAMLQMVESNILKPEKLVTQTVKIEEAGDVLMSMGEFKTVGVTVVDRW
ncbi:zinc-dependent alcohol dehydrogenase family protein [Halalkalibacter nanhaiisediminis]|uniref:Alcohol dehydrogenase n=1 Tax=Halalkalibacter nanhaiisediminis TaxID=688079 RepID=A0A562QNA2_9BACI|nr:zinc-dependent alcohol dehydrogenase family protein [Halalkalibacter nanhaiisediminis]TWI58175.1 alcohol dehydrogenase [Halalkalibacter nanhaiisediminis]